MKRTHLGIICLVCIVLILGACSAPGAPSPPAAPAALEPAADAAPSPPAAPAAPRAEAAAPPAAADFFAEEQADGGYFDLQINAPDEDSARMMVYTVGMRLQSGDIMRSWNLINSTVEHMGGFFPQRDFQGDDIRRDPSKQREAYFLIRLPTMHLSEFIVIIEDNFNIWRLSISAQDEAIGYQHRDATQINLQDQEAWLVEQLENDELTVEEGLELQDELARVRRQIVDAISAQARLRDDVIYSTIAIELFEAFPPVVIEEEEVIPPVFSERLSSAATASANAALVLGQGLILVLVAILPFALGAAVLAGIVLMITRAVNKIRRSSKVRKLLSTGEEDAANENDGEG